MPHSHNGPGNLIKPSNLLRASGTNYKESTSKNRSSKRMKKGDEEVLHHNYPRNECSVSNEGKQTTTSSKEVKNRWKFISKLFKSRKSSDRSCAEERPMKQTTVRKSNNK